MQRYDYRVCSVQYGRVTFVNGDWLGGVPAGDDMAAALESCPNVWEYLDGVGREGWELVSVVTHPQAQAEAVQDVLYLKRPSQ